MWNGCVCGWAVCLNWETRSEELSGREREILGRRGGGVWRKENIRPSSEMTKALVSLTSTQWQINHQSAPRLSKQEPPVPPPPPTYTDHLLIYDLKLVFILVNVLSQPDVSVSSKVWSVWTKIVLREWEELPTLTFPAASNRVPRYITSSCTGAVICEHKVKTLCPKCTLAELRGNIVGFASICEIPYYYMIFVII